MVKCLHLCNHYRITTSCLKSTPKLSAYEKTSPNAAVTALELIPNNRLTEARPVKFSITFLEKKMQIQYEISMDLGTFLDEEYCREIKEERLRVNGEDIFTRSEDLMIGNLKGIEDFLSDITNQNKENVMGIAQNGLGKDELFLTNGFKLIFSQKLVKLIVDWFTDKCMVIYRADTIQLIKRFADPKKKAVYVEKTTNQAAELFGINSNAVGYVVSDDEPEAKLYSIFKNAENEKNTAIVSEIFESYGTIRFINMFPLVIKAIMTGGTLIVDEFDACNSSYVHRKQYMTAINRAKDIMKKNEDSGYVLHHYKGYKYYKENPSLAVWEAIEKILMDCELV